MKDANRHPFADDDQVELAVVIVVHPGGRRDHPDIGERWCQLLSDVTEVSGAVVLEQITARRQTVATADRAPADEQIDVPIAIEVARQDAGAAFGETGQGFGIALEVSLAVVAIEPVLQRVVVAPKLVAATDDVE